MLCDRSACRLDRLQIVAHQRRDDVECEQLNLHGPGDNRARQLGFGDEIGLAQPLPETRRPTLQRAPVVRVLEAYVLEVDLPLLQQTPRILRERCQVRRVGVGQSPDPALKNVAAWLERTSSRPSAEASLHPVAKAGGMRA